MSNNKHLTLADRYKIETLLGENRSVRYIANCLSKSPSTISREIQKHTFIYKGRSNDCHLKNTCTKIQVCNSSCKKKCSKCVSCRKYCDDYVQTVCNFQLAHPLMICNHCSNRTYCGYERRIYEASKAHKEYRTTLVGMREGFDLSYEDLCSINSIVSPLIKKGQSPYHIKQALGDSLSVSESTIRRLIDKGELDVRNIDLRDKVKRKQRKKTERTMHNENTVQNKNGHLYSDYLAYIQENEVTVVQMDCVEGLREESKVLLTLHYPSFHFQLAFIMQSHTAKSVVETFDMIENLIGKEMFSMLFGIILTDNGHEFSDITALERSVFGGTRTKIFFCEPNRSDEKGACENNHKLIRYIIPKGTSLESLTQTDVILMMNHINSYNRKALFGKCPFDLVMNAFPTHFFEKLGLKKIPPQDILLTPTLLKK